MNSRDGTKSGFWAALRRSNWIAAAIAFAVQLPIRPWSYTGGQPERRSALVGNARSVSRGAEKMRSR
jgi:hypothetical protein